MVKVLNSKEITEHIALYSSVFPDIEFQIEETIIKEVAAAQIISRSVLIKRVLQKLDSIGGISEDQVRRIIQKTEHEGNISSGSGGMIAYAPLRVVKKSSDSFMFVGSLPISYLSEKLSVSFDSWTGRVLNLSPNSEQDLIPQVDELDGIMVSAETWAGLERTMKAGKQWLDFINEQSFHTAERSESYYRHLVNETSWQSYLPESKNVYGYRRWQKKDNIKHLDPSLWRVRYNSRNWVYLWSDIRLIENFQGYPLSYDEAIRTQFSFDKQMNVSQSGKFVSSQNDARWGISLSFRIPKSEYRYISTVADTIENVTNSEDEISGFVFNIKERAEKAQSILTDRLGIKWLETGIE